MAGRPGDATLTRLRLAWWSEAVATLGSGPEPVDPDLVRLAPLLDGRADRVMLVEAAVAAWDGQVGEGPEHNRRPLARARAALLLDGAGVEAAGAGADRVGAGGGRPGGGAGGPARRAGVALARAVCAATGCSPGRRCTGWRAGASGRWR